jgi:hypothetical protein
MLVVHFTFRQVLEPMAATLPFSLALRVSRQVVL